MKPIAEIPGQLITRELAYQLRLEEEQYIILIPKSLLSNLGITTKDLDFELFVENYKLSLVGKAVTAPKVMSPIIKEVKI